MNYEYDNLSIKWGCGLISYFSIN